MKAHDPCVLDLIESLLKGIWCHAILTHQVVIGWRRNVVNCSLCCTPKRCQEVTGFRGIEESLRSYGFEKSYVCWNLVCQRGEQDLRTMSVWGPAWLVWHSLHICLS